MENEMLLLCVQRKHQFRSVDVIVAIAECVKNTKSFSIIFIFLKLYLIMHVTIGVSVAVDV